MLLQQAVVLNSQVVHSFTYNLNLDNGLPDNLIYRMITDRYGYLWMCTQKGVVKYNGYDLKIFNVSNGLSNEDVWDLLEDNKGRIWLGTRADEVGYLRNGRYTKAHINDHSISLYTRSIRKKGDNIFFQDEGTSTEQHGLFFVERNDTINTYVINGALFADSAFGTIKGVPFFTTQAGDLYFWKERNLYKCTTPLPGWRRGQKLTVGKPVTVERITHKWLDQYYLNIGSYLVFPPPKQGGKAAVVLNIENGSCRELAVNTYGVNEPILYLYPDVINRFLYIITGHYILTFDKELRFIQREQIHAIIGNNQVDGSKIKSIVENTLWPKCVGSTTNGAWINYAIANRFVKQPVNLHGLSYIGSKKEGISFWRNDAKGTLVSLSPAFRLIEERPTTGKIEKMLHLRGNLFASVGAPRATWQNAAATQYSQIEKRSYDIAPISGDTFLVATTSCLEKITPGNKLYRKLVDSDRYDHVVKDAVHNSFVSYRKDKILLIRPTTRQAYTKKDLGAAGFVKIENIMIDEKFGNTFIKDKRHVRLCNNGLNNCVELFQDINLDGALLSIYDDVLIVSGRFGILFCKIQGPGQLSDPVVLPNVKDINYKVVNDCHPTAKQVLLNTNNGTFTVSMPDSNEFTTSANSYPAQYRLIITYKDTVIAAKTGDSIHMDQKNMRLYFDIINPLGNGEPKYVYKIAGDTTWQEMNANEMSLPAALDPGRYYTLSIRAYDNVWRSSITNLSLYIEPYWWQTTTGKRLTWLGGITMAALLFSLAILITRKRVLATTRKRNELMELELKSIYAQINPHFIFNSLNSALLLVSRNKMEDAYAHISRFARLLRSYIKSSRNKLVTIADEITNLEDYIQLQQMRFKEKFDHTIIVDENVKVTAVKIPSLLLQPLVENAINHGLLPKKERGHLTIGFSMPESGLLICRIEDDGVGRNNTKETGSAEKTKDASYGNLLLKDLVTIFNRYEQMHIEIIYTDKQGVDTGTIVTIKIKNPEYGK